MAPRGADQRHLRVPCDQTLEEGAGDGAKQVEEEIADVAERVFDIVAEHPQKQHVAAEVENIRVQEGIGEVAQALGNDDKLRGQFHGVVDDGRDEAEAQHRRVGEILAAERRGEVDERIDRDQADRHILQPDVSQPVGVVKRDEHRSLALLPLGKFSGSCPESIARRHFRCH